jgi:hypothetical protein
MEPQFDDRIDDASTFFVGTSWPFVQEVKVNAAIAARQIALILEFSNKVVSVTIIYFHLL